MAEFVWLKALDSKTKPVLFPPEPSVSLETEKGLMENAKPLLKMLFPDIE
ncbi:hypothetical protein SC09_Contig25orf00525 [Bacillus subtilis]|uniref:Uncharacterized protein n=1 Tax=Bacillus subtilis TaxID=1423 RepID=A0A0D1KWW9_BACIU|nr:hypothetical protein SC09_Contig25orf00525 [Bacillus subtilis]